jgi:hypothetical protein
VPGLRRLEDDTRSCGLLQRALDSQLAAIEVDAAEVMITDGGLELSVSRNATLELSSTPDSPETASTVLTSLWQRDLFAVKAERFVRWVARRTDAAAYI